MNKWPAPSWVAVQSENFLRLFLESYTYAIGCLPNFLMNLCHLRHYVFQSRKTKSVTFCMNTFQGPSLNSAIFQLGTSFLCLNNLFPFGTSQTFFLSMTGPFFFFLMYTYLHLSLGWLLFRILPRYTSLLCSVYPEKARNDGFTLVASLITESHNRIYWIPKSFGFEWLILNKSTRFMCNQTYKAW